MHKTRWPLRLMVVVAVLASVLVTVWAQNMDEGGVIVSEDMTIDDALNPNPTPSDSSEVDAMTSAAPTSDLSDAMGSDLVMPATDTTETVATDTTTSADETTDVLSGMDVAPAASSADPLAGLDLNEAPAEAPVAESAAEPATDDLGALTMEEPAPAALAEESAPPAESLDGLAFEQEKGGPVPLAATTPSEPPADDLGGLTLGSEPSPAPSGDVQSMEAAVGASQAGVPADLISEESLVDDSLTSGSPASLTAGEGVSGGDIDSMMQDSEGGAGEVATGGAPVEPASVMPETAVEAAVGAPIAITPAPRQASSAGLSSQEKAIKVLREGEELRRRAFAEHAAEKLALADQAFAKRDYAAAQRFYDQAASALDQAGGRAESRADLKRAREGAMESLYRRALELRKAGDLEDARKLASEAAVQGHPRAPELVAKIDKDLAKPPAKPQAEKPRWKQDEYVKKTEDVHTLLTQGRQHYLANELDSAQKSFEAVLELDPHNTEAIRWREKVTQTRFERASMELETTRQDMMSQVREAWNPRDYGAGETPKREDQETQKPTRGDTPTDLILKKMESIIIPEIDFRQANINDVVQFLQESSIEYDPAPDKRGVNIILNMGAGDAAAMAPAAAAGEFGDFGATEEAPAAAGGAELITFRAREMSLLGALKIVTDVANLKYRIEDNVVMILPFNVPDKALVHRMYDVLPTVGERISAIRESTAATGTSERGDFTALGGGGAGGSEAGATDWKAFFSDLGVQWPIGSSIKYVPAIGKLMVANTVDNLAVFEQRLAALNIVPKQVEIEARFVEVNQTDLNSLGFEWLLTDNWEIAQKKSDANLPLSQRQRIEMGETSFTKGNRYVTDNAANEKAPDDLRTASDDLLGIATVLTNPELAVILHALEQKGHADLLSAPKVTTQSGVEAQIKVVTEYIYPSDYTIEPGVSPTLNSDGSVQTAGTPPVVTPAEFETREVGVILTVLPEVSTENEMINLTMSPEVVTDPTWRNYGQTFTDAAGNILQIPIEQPFFHSRSISTSILIYNGATVVMGGMITEDRQEVDDKVPFLGDIPLLGRLFQSKYEHSIKKNLLIFVTARLVDPAGRPVGRANFSASAEAFSGETSGVK
ncbi:MAG: hypothetical protein K8T26_11810 [Lentisphaerae bacterium]|nr:hypothetical protein [Lentisphaerota bacterium]